MVDSNKGANGLDEAAARPSQLHTTSTIGAISSGLPFHHAILYGVGTLGNGTGGPEHAVC